LHSQHVKISGDELDLTEQHSNVEPGQRDLLPDWNRLTTVQSGPGDFVIVHQEGDTSSPVLDQSVQRRSARAQRRRSVQNPILESSLLVIQERLEDSRSSSEPTEHCPFAQAGPRGQSVHGQFVSTLLREHLARRDQ
jgi:hypothetical protein